MNPFLQSLAMLYKRGHRELCGTRIEYFIAEQLQDLTRHLADKILTDGPGFVLMPSERSDRSGDGDDLAVTTKMGVEPLPLAATVEGALLEALESYNPDAGTQFITWAHPRLVWRLQDLQRKHERGPVRSSAVDLDSNPEQLKQVDWLPELDTLSKGQAAFLAARLSADLPTDRAIAEHLRAHRNTVHNRRRQLEAKLGHHWREVNLHTKGRRYLYQPAPAPEEARPRMVSDPTFDNVWARVKDPGAPIVWPAATHAPVGGAEPPPDEEPPAAECDVIQVPLQHPVIGPLWRRLMDAHPSRDHVDPALTDDESRQTIETLRQVELPRAQRRRALRRLYKILAARPTAAKQVNEVLTALWRDNPGLVKEPTRQMARDNWPAWLTIKGPWSHLFGLPDNVAKQIANILQNPAAVVGEHSAAERPGEVIRRENEHLAKILAKPGQPAPRGRHLCTACTLDPNAECPTFMQLDPYAPDHRDHPRLPRELICARLGFYESSSYDDKPTGRRVECSGYIEAEPWAEDPRPALLKRQKIAREEVDPPAQDLCTFSYNKVRG